MTQEIVNVGSAPGDGTGDKGQVPFQKVNNNDTELYGSETYFGVDGGSAGASVVTISYPIPATFTLKTGTTTLYVPIAANPGAATLNLQGSGAFPIVNTAGNALAGGELQPTTPIMLMYNGAAWQLLIPNTQSLLSPFISAVVSGLLNPTTTVETAALAAMSPPGSVVNSSYRIGYVDRYVNNSGSSVDSAPGFNAAYRVATQIGCTSGHGATEPYYVQSTVNYTTAGSVNQNGVVTVYDGAPPADTGNFPIIAQLNGAPVFDCTGTVGLQWYRVGVTTAPGFAPNTAWLFARNSLGNAAGAGLQRMQHCYAIGTFSIACVYNYGAEDDFYYGCYFSNTATTPSTACMQFTANNVGLVTSPYVTIATGSLSTTDHVIEACQLYNSAGTATSYALYIESIIFLRARDCWMGCFSASSGGQAIIGVNQINAPSVNITIDNLMGEQNGANVSNYGILFFNTARNNVAWSITNCLFPNTSFAIAGNGTLTSSTIQGITEQPSTSNGFSFAAVTSSILNTGPLKLAIGTSTDNTITGYSEGWTITTRSNDDWHDTGVANKTWTPVLTGLTHSGTLSINDARQLLQGNQCTVEISFQSSVSISATAGQTITGLPFPEAYGSIVDVTDVTTPIALGQGYVSGSTLVMPAFSVTTHTVLVRATYFVA